MKNEREGERKRIMELKGKLEEYMNEKWKKKEWKMNKKVIQMSHFGIPLANKTKKFLKKKKGKWFHPKHRSRNRARNRERERERERERIWWNEWKIIGFKSVEKMKEWRE
jgi:hypothetical protein